MAPIVCTVEVSLAPAEAFGLFVRMGDWWPLATNSLGLRNAVACVLEPRLQGRIYERTAEGLESIWGTVVAWQEPASLRFTWHPGRHASTAQWVEVRFSAQSGGTRVALEHGGWEQTADRAETLRARYAEGWPSVLERFRAKASGQAAKSLGKPTFHG